jgi:rieske iron-sulfur protein
LSDDQQDAEKQQASSETSDQQKANQSESQSQDNATQQQQPQKPVPPRPRIGTPIGQTPAPAPTPSTPEGAKPAAPAPVARPRIGTPVGTPKPATSTPASAPATQPPPSQGAQPASQPARPRIGTPVGTARPTIGTPAGAAKPQAATGATTTTAAAPPRPVVSTPAAAIASQPKKKVESKTEISRRHFLQGLAVVGGLVALGSFVPLGPYLTGSVESSTITSQIIQDSKTGLNITPETIATAEWETFVFPRTGNANVDNDTFHQFVIIKLPQGFTAPSNLSTTDSKGNIYVGFSRVCVHLWCLWSYVPTDMRMECPCHGSQYVPGSGTYPLLPIANDQPPGKAVEGPASLQTPPNNMLPIIPIKYNASSNTFTASSAIIGQVGCGQDC